ncbi:unnamed protein product [Arctogadus glacialis]
MYQSNQCAQTTRDCSWDLCHAHTPMSSSSTPVENCIAHTLQRRRCEPQDVLVLVATHQLSQGDTLVPLNRPEI